MLRTVVHDYEDENGDVVLREEQDLVYRQPAPAQPSAVECTPAHQVEDSLLARGERYWEFRTDPTRLMRFSSLTANAHRIHYDWPYATQIEGYPDLVVHGPLISIALAAVAALENPGRAAMTISHRNVQPLFCGHRAHVVLSEGPTSTVAEMVSGAESVHARVELTWAA